ncbi:aminodeoxyfutalosine deaminase [Actinoalloteichus hoggarensis]|uniref:Aminodeoxyfutalosine deaminase n=1 Tax=Actinoalloteichus hoggarensis TaxID=1470176 RepID=A0A221W2M7_9PSEU|nr:adenosine deaminase [Actinoalloteichus hoggarensis]ASO20062.1 Aminodeoxyfutalosine deaminase [Actinoalloteichus hoggarensis]MBB5919227.1 aminodeoxyfutalosine deaminase [Actinoalloteichus hoggarensis]
MPESTPPVHALIDALPKVELHVHLEGSLAPTTLLTLARKHDLPAIPSTLDALREWYAFRDFPHFIDVYLASVQALRDEEDFALLAVETARDLARQNVRYAEVHLSLLNHLERDVPAEVVFAGVEAGRRQAEQEHGITLRWIPDFPGHYGVEAGEQALRETLAVGPDSVIGFGVGGIEVERDQFADIFAKARAAGLHSLPHAGETHGPDRVWSAIRALRAERIGHGIGSMRDPELVAYLRDTQLPVDVSPTSNVATRMVATAAEHPLPRMLDEGVFVTLNSDDPPMFGTDLTNEYRTAHEIGLSPEQLVRLARNGVSASFLAEDRKAALHAEIDSVFARWQADEN